MKVNPSWEATIEIEGKESEEFRESLFEKIFPIGILEMSEKDPFSYFHRGVWCRANRRSIIWKRIG